MGITRLRNFEIIEQSFKHITDLNFGGPFADLGSLKHFPLLKNIDFFTLWEKAFENLDSGKDKFESVKTLQLVNWLSTSSGNLTLIADFFPNLQLLYFGRSMRRSIRHTTVTGTYDI